MAPRKGVVDPLREDVPDGPRRLLRGRLRRVHRAPVLPDPHRKAIRTTNPRERIFVGERRRTKVIPEFSHGEPPAMELMYSALILGGGASRGIHMRVFETRQLEVIRQVRCGTTTPPCDGVSIVRGHVPTHAPSKLRT